MAKNTLRRIDGSGTVELLLIGFSIVGVGLGYASSIVAARLLGPDAFPEYAVVIATMELLCAVAEAGVGKYSLKALPAYAASKQWSLASGYWRFSCSYSLVREYAACNLCYSGKKPS